MSATLNNVPDAADQAALLIPAAAAGQLIGCAPKTTANWISTGKFPIPTFKLGGLRMCRADDVRRYVESLGSGLPLFVSAELVQTESIKQKRGPGRPRKTISGGAQ